MLILELVLAYGHALLPDLAIPLLPPSVNDGPLREIGLAGDVPRGEDSGNAGDRHKNIHEYVRDLAWMLCAKLFRTNERARDKYAHC